MTAAYDAVVIGAGHNGLVCAGYLARAGLRVVVVERRERPGGAADTAELAPGFRVPALAHEVGRLRRSVARDLRLADHGLRVVHPEARVHVAEAGGPGLTLWSDARRTADELAARSPSDAAAYSGFDRKIRALGSFLARLHAATPPDLRQPSVADAFTGARLGRGLRKLGGPAQVRETLRILPMAVAEVVGEELQDDLLRAAVAARGVRYSAMGPWAAGTALHMLADSAAPEAGAAGPTAFALGGPGALADALGSAVRASGGEVRLGAEVSAILTRRGVASGVALSTGEELAAPVVISGADVQRTLLGLVDPEEIDPVLAWEISAVRTPGAVAKVNLALDALPSFGVEEPRLAGRILLAESVDALERASDAAKYGRVSESPFLEATIPTLADPALAPDGAHVMSVLAQWAPYELREGDWETAGDDLGDLVLKRLEDVAPGISDLVRERQVVTPLDLEHDYGLTGGHPLHGEPGLDQWFAWRPIFGFARYRMPLRGLYLCGSSAHPGGGLTGGPGANAAREILRDLNRS